MKGNVILGVGPMALSVVAGLVLLSGNPAQATDDLGPEEVVTGFYDWYLGSIDLEAGRNPLGDRAYRSSELLSEDFVAEVDALLDSFEHGGYDPFLLAQDVPVKFALGKAVVTAEEASIVVELFWGGNPIPSERTVALSLTDGEWKITGVSF